ncbi:reverse transcriptase domain-containing protein, partial [Tanacetum coccineum]
ITTRSGVAYEGPSIPTNPSPKKVVERETEETKDKEETNFQGSTAHIPPPVIPIFIPEPDVLKTLPKTTPIPESDIPKSLPKPNIPYPSRHALLLMPRFVPTIKSLLMNKEKLLELAKIPLNENCSAMLLKKLLKKLGDPGKFLIPCNFPGMDVCHALADLGASINLMPLSIWKKHSLPDLTLTRMNLELADRSITCPKGVTEDIFVKVGNFHFLTDFVVVDFEVDPRVPLILGRSFLRTSRALIDVYEGELVLRDGNEQITFHVDGTSKHPPKHINESIKMVNDSCKDSFKRFTDEPALVCSLERISKKRTKNEAKTTKPDTEWKSVEKTKSRPSPSVKKSTQVNPDKSRSQQAKRSRNSRRTKNDSVKYEWDAKQGLVGNLKSSCKLCGVSKSLVTQPQGWDDAETNVATYDDLAFKTHSLGWNVKQIPATEIWLDNSSSNNFSGKSAAIFSGKSAAFLSAIHLIPVKKVFPAVVAFDLLRDALSAIFGLSELKFTYTSVHIVRAIEISSEASDKEL